MEYELTDLGRTLMEPIAALTSWAEHYGSVSSMRSSTLRTMLFPPD